MAENTARPLGIKIISVLFLIAGIFYLIGGIGGVLDIEALKSSVGGIAGIIAGLIYMLIGYGIWSGWKVMWYLGVIFAIIGLISAIFSIFNDDYMYVINVIIEIVILWYLFKANVKSFFGI